MTRTDRGQAEVYTLTPAVGLVFLALLALVIYTAGVGIGLDHRGAVLLTGTIALLVLAAIAVYQHLGGELGVQEYRTRSREDRGAITIPDVVMYALGIFVLSALVPVLMTQLNANIGVMSRGTELLVLGAIPLTVLVFFAVIFRKAVSP